MRRCLNIAFGVALLVLWADRSAGAVGLSALCVPVSFELGRPVSSIECGIDRAASLTVFQRYRSALDAVEDPSDSLRMGIVACYAEQYARAAGFLRCQVNNAFLDWFRGYYRALALRKTENYRDAAAELDSVLARAERVKLVRSSASLISARALDIDVMLHDDSLFALRGIPPDAPSRSPRELLALASGLADRGRDSLAATYLIAAAGRLPAGTDKRALERIFAKLPPLYSRMDEAALRSLANAALASGLNGEAETITEKLLAKDRADPENLILRGRLLAARGKGREAVAVYDKVASSEAGVLVKPYALALSAALEYRLGNTERAVEKYRRLGRMPGKCESLDTAARIDVTLGRHDEAIDLWKEYVAASPRCPLTQTPTVALRQASLLHWLRRDAEAQVVLGRVDFSRSTDVRRRMEIPGKLYWLERTSPGDSARAVYARELTIQYPRSFYAYALTSSLDSLPARGTPDSFPSRIDSMLAGEGRLVDSLTMAVAALGESPAKPGLSACRYFLDRGLLSEAGECVTALGASRGIDTLETLDLYLKARALGFYDVAIRLVNGSYRTTVPARLKERLSHPVAFPTLLAERQTTAGLPPELILAIMYAESKFGVSAVSGSGAMGVMQLMPATARWAAQHHGLPRECAENLLDPECNMRIASRYLVYLLGRYDNSLVGALAAYNAGEGRMRRWQDMFHPAGDPMIGLELIGPSETNAYVKEVLEALCYYRALGAGEGRP